MRQSEATSPERLSGESEFDRALRPLRFDDFNGQEKITSNLRVFVKAALQRGESLDHVLLTGPPGLGKTTLAHIIANEMGSSLKISSGPVLDKPGELAGLLTNLQRGDVLFIDEIHRLSPVVEEYLYPALEDFRLDIIIDSGPNARSVQLNLEHFTMIGATTRAGLLTAPLRARFGITNRLDYYAADTIQNILVRSARLLNIGCDEQGLHEIARRSRGTPRIANRLLRRCRDFAQAEPSLAKNKGLVTIDVAMHALEKLEVDTLGLDDMDKRILLSIIEKYQGGPVGLGTIGAAVSEDPGTIEEVYEPYLLLEGFIKRTPRGREATAKAYKHFGKTRSSADGLFDNAS